MSALLDKEFDSFKKLSDNSWARQVVGGYSNLISDISFDDVQTEAQSFTVDHIKYYLNSVLQRTIEVTYSDICRTSFTRVRKI
jgi:hypothetical protein